MKMKLNSLVLIAVFIPTLAFAQENYQTQFLTGTYLDQVTQYNITSGTAKYSAEEKLQQDQKEIDERGSQVPSAITRDRMTPNAPLQNFNEPKPGIGK